MPDACVNVMFNQHDTGSIVRSKFPIGEHGFVSIVTDTEGNMIGLHSVNV
jgi:predicted enzyme related to lactoylglutathione lyase